MERPTKEYLIELLNDSLQKFNDYECSPIDESQTDITYIATRKINHMGLMDGLAGLSQMRTYKVKESSTIRSNCSFYNKFYKRHGEVQKIESYVAGHDRIDVIYFAHYEGDKRYLFNYYHFSSGLKKGYGYNFATQYDGDRVVEEYMFKKTQIVYWKYDYSNPKRVGCYSINFVPNGNEPVLAECEGYYDPESFEYTEMDHFYWYEKDK